MSAVLQELYKSDVAPALCKEFGISNVHCVPKLVKVVLNTCLKEAVQDSKIVDRALEEMALIAGQRPVITRAKKSVSNFKLRAGMPLGCCVTLRGQRMYDFVARLVRIALPRVRDFKGVGNKGFDGQGNYTLGIKDYTIFPEVDLNKLTNPWGMNITFVTNTDCDDQARRLLALMGMPFRK